MPFIIDLFDETESQETAQNETQSTENASNQGQRRGNGRFVPKGEANVDSEFRLRDLEKTLAERTQESIDRRRENKQLKEAVESQAKQFQAISQKALRSEARAALTEAGVIHSDVVDIFLKRAADKVKVDSDFEVLGIEEALAAFKTSHPQFFKAAETKADESVDDGKKADDKAKADETAEKDERKNSTSRGASLRGAFTNRRGVQSKSDENKSGDDILNDYLSTLR
jgi:antitoxin component of RelBE/YafQ-DinJ toxin-antitoxin module